MVKTKTNGENVIDMLVTRPVGTVAGASVVWPIGAIIVACLVVFPIGAIGLLAFSPTENIWDHLATTVLPRYILTTILLMSSVGVGVAIIGTGTAWLIAMCRFPGRKFFAWALVLPMAMPAYVIAYTYTDLLEYAGPVQTFLRALFGWTSTQDYWFPAIRSIGGAATMMTLVLYPYVFLMARVSFLTQSITALEVSRTLGRTPIQSFLSVGLPLARPAIVVGVTLALMETLNDFGTVDYFAVRTLTAGIFDVWFGMGNAGGACQLTLVLLGFVVFVVWIERASRHKQRFHETSTRLKPAPGIKLQGWKSMLAILACSLPITIGFLVPTIVLSNYAMANFSEVSLFDYFKCASNTIILAALAAVFTLSIGLFLAYAYRLHPAAMVRSTVRLATLGYAVPGVVIAIGILLPMGSFENSLDALMRSTVGISTGLIISGTIFALLIAYIVRFLVMGIGSVEAGLSRVTPHIDMAARTLGHGPLATLIYVHFPLIRSSILTGALLVFVDTMKELPATLVLRPFNFDTLATFVYQYASDEMLEECSLAALTIVLAGIIPVILLNQKIGQFWNRF